MATTKGIKLSFDNGVPTLVAPEDRIPYCLGNKKCRYFIEKPIDLGNGLGYDQFFCKFVNKPVMDIRDEDRKCPLMIWYVAPFMRTSNLKEGENCVETIVAGFGNDKHRPKNRRGNSVGRNVRNKRRSRKNI